MMRPFLLLFPLWLASFLPTEAQNFAVDGTIEKEGDPFKEAEVYLYERNEVIGKTSPNWLGKFSFRLGLNSHYTVEVRASEHVIKRISFDTSIPEDVEDPDPGDFSFDVVMLEAERIPEDKAGLFDFPVGRVFFDPYEQEFRFNTQYTAKIRREFRKALNMEMRTVERTE